MLFTELLDIILLVMEYGFRSRVRVEDKAMKMFYHKVWLPFTFNKKRILILAIASYIAMC